jgi:hypothetical protein
MEGKGEPLGRLPTSAERQLGAYLVIQPDLFLALKPFSL